MRRYETGLHFDRDCVIVDKPLRYQTDRMRPHIGKTVEEPRFKLDLKAPRKLHGVRRSRFSVKSRHGVVGVGRLWHVARD